MRNQALICNKNSQNSEQFMQIALNLAEEARLKGEVPVGAIIVRDNKIIGRGYNQPISSSDPSAHAEIIAIRDAAQHIQNYRLNNSTIYVTLQPCSMCMGAIAHARISHLIFAAFDPKKDQNYCNHEFTQTGGILETQASQILIDFFREKRK